MLGKGPIADLVLRLTTTLCIEEAYPWCSLFRRQTHFSEEACPGKPSAKSTRASLKTELGVTAGPCSLPQGFQEPLPSLAAPPRGQSGVLVKGKSWKTRSHSEWAKRGGRGFWLRSKRRGLRKEGSSKPLPRLFSETLKDKRGAKPSALPNFLCCLESSHLPALAALGGCLLSPFPRRRPSGTDGEGG